MLRQLTVLVLALSFCCEVTWSAPAHSTDLLALRRRLGAVMVDLQARKLDMREKVVKQESFKQFVINKLKKTNISPKSLAEVVHYLLNPSAGPILNHPINVSVLKKLFAGKSSQQKQ